MLKKILAGVKAFFRTPRIGDVTPTYLKDPIFMADEPGALKPFLGYIHNEEGKHRQKMESIALAEMALQKKAHQHSLTIQHRNMVITLSAVFVALFSATSAIIIAMNQTPPNVIIEVKADK